MKTLLQPGTSLAPILLLLATAARAAGTEPAESPSTATEGAADIEIAASGMVGATPAADAGPAIAANAVGAAAEAGPADIPFIDTAVLLDYLAGRDPFTLLDARSVEEYEIGHVYNAVNVPHDAVDAYADALPKDLDAPLVAYCKTGKRALQLAARLREQGYTNVRVLGPTQMFWSDTAPMFNCGAPASARSFLPESR